jgi:protein TonB
MEKDGSLSNVTIIEGIEPKVNERVVELVSQSPKWNPAKINGRLVRSSYSLPIAINVHK